MAVKVSPTLDDRAMVARDYLLSGAPIALMPAELHEALVKREALNQAWGNHQKRLARGEARWDSGRGWRRVTSKRNWKNRLHQRAGLRTQLVGTIFEGIVLQARMHEGQPWVDLTYRPKGK